MSINVRPHFRHIAAWACIYGLLVVPVSSHLHLAALTHEVCAEHGELTHEAQGGETQGHEHQDVAHSHEHHGAVHGHEHHGAVHGHEHQDVAHSHEDIESSEAPQEPLIASDTPREDPHGHGCGLLASLWSQPLPAQHVSSTDSPIAGSLLLPLRTVEFRPVANLLLWAPKTSPPV